MRKKVSIIGSGNVGATTALFILHSGMADVVLLDIVEGIPQGKALDMAEACPLWDISSKIKGTNNYADTADSDLVVITAGFPRKPGMSRSDLLHANANVVKASCREIAKSWKTTGFSCQRVMGMGGILDASRLRAFISWELQVAPEDIEALVLGGHGDDMIPLSRFTAVKGIPLTELLSKRKIESLIERTRKGGAEIVHLLKTGSAYYAPAAATFHMIKAILLDEKRLLPCSAYLNGEYGVKDLYMGVPVILGQDGVEKIIEVKLSKEEKTQFRKSSASVRKLIKTLSI
jgi:malate dehydrogenase